MSTANPYRLRAPSLNDLIAVTELLIACDIAITGESEVTEEETADYWRSPGFVLETDAVVAVDPEGVVTGYEEVLSPGDELYPIDGYVHPEHRGHGIGALLLDWAERRASHMSGQTDSGSARLRANIYASEVDAAELLQERGFTHVRRNYRMHIDLDQPVPAPGWPEGVEARPFRPGHDERVAYEIMRETFQDVWGHVSAPYEEWLAEYVGVAGSDGRMESVHGFDPELWTIVWEGDTPVAAALGRRRGEGGWIRGLGVRKPWRGRGVALAMLRHAFGLFRERGFPFAGLGVDSQSLTGANRLYLRAGMRVTEEYDMFEKPLPSPGV